MMLIPRPRLQTRAGCHHIRRMCGRYASFLPAEALTRLFGTTGPLPNLGVEVRTVLRAVVGILGTDPKNRLAAALASLGRAFMARDS
jgi:hypothetical protein